MPSGYPDTPGGVQRRESDGGAGVSGRIAPRPRRDQELRRAGTWIWLSAGPVSGVDSTLSIREP
jgi:hypothetical protein